MKNFKTTLALFTPYLLRNKTGRKRCLLAMGLILVDVLAASLVPYFSKNIVDSLSINLSSTLGLTVILLGFFWTLDKIILHLQDIIFFPVINDSIRNITYDVVEHIHQIPLLSYHNLSMPEVLSSIKRISMSARLFFKVFFLMIIPSAIKLIIAIFMTLKLGLISLAIIPIVLCCLFTLFKGTFWYVKMREKSWQISDQVTMRINDSILNTKITRPFHHFEMESIKVLLDDEAKHWSYTNTRLHLIYIAIGLILGLLFTSTLIIACQAIQKGILTIGDFIMLKGQLIAAFLPLKSFTTEFRQLAEATVDIKKISQILNLPSKVIMTATKGLNEVIRVNNLSFSYDENQTIFEKLSFQFNLGEKVAIIGENGSGKSTLALLLSGFLKPIQGAVFIQGLDSRACSPEAFTHIVHCIPQDFRLFNLSLRENLSYGLHNVSTKALEEVLEQVELLEFLPMLQKDNEVPLGEMGLRLSGGEKQRVAIARALLVKPRILILDETLHALTIERERNILNNIFKTIETVILISHRKSALPLMDKILKIQDRQVVLLDNFKKNWEAVSA